MFIVQVKHAIKIFERVLLVIFDNAFSHTKFSEDALNAANMNLYPKGKQPVLRESLWDGKVQKNDTT